MKNSLVDWFMCRRTWHSDNIGFVVNVAYYIVLQASHIVGQSQKKDSISLWNCAA